MKIIPEIWKDTTQNLEKNLQPEVLKDYNLITNVVFGCLGEAGFEIIRNIIEQIDEALVKGAKAIRKEQKITIKQRRVKREIMTPFGNITYCRTYFQMANGEYIYLTDHLIGVEKFERISKVDCKMKLDTK